MKTLSNKSLTILSFLFFAIVLSACKSEEDGADAYGNFEADEVMISSRMGGEFVQLKGNEGEMVKMGQVLGMVDTTELHLQKKQLLAQRAAVLSGKTKIRAEVKVLRQQITNLQKDENRMQRMFDDGAVEEKKLDDITGQINLLNRQIEVLGANFGAINNQVDVIMAQAALIDNKVNDCYLHSPVDGVILEQYVEQGEMTSPGRAVYKLSDISSLVLKVYISGDQLSQVKIGQIIDVLIDVPDGRYKTYKGTIAWISDKSEFTPKIIQTKQERVKLVYAMKVDVPNDGSLKIGMPGEVVITKEVK